MTSRETAIQQLSRVLPPLREEGWFLTPSNTTVTDVGVVVLIFRDSDAQTRSDLERRFNDLDPALQVESRFSPMARHAIFRL